ncbi:DNA gyrase subunit A [candidate division WOR-3 bacterium]|uniref:DNA gyrase subunit A n=1 Tax=candidate division WOR-3 bacterium TaxID=2052148 RepID=A0A9D5KC21_UNCW3|nr:DNA gyrase subunit A [candidate division WOR-3 bacterium]MBD3364971.1 DNA gyrase subunit A [candidate division WOR-3 bacterium]
MNESRINQVYVEDEIRSSFLDYAMSVIVSRALPDIRDGLKPVQRRILYSMNDLGLDPGKAYRKCATVVGDVLGKYHPHGDQAVYDALARMTQEFSLRYPLVDGQGNFGSIDGDPPAAYRYTECKLKPLAVSSLAELDSETVDFIPNFDGSRQEPEVLPAAFPNLLVNGASGIAVGMATSIPPHNFTEISDALIALIDNPDATDDEIADIVEGPDFPTGGLILGRDGIREAYRTGRGKVTVRGKVRFEEPRPGRQAIVITEIPYQLNKALLVERIIKLVKTKKLSDISDLRDESDREGIRVVLELKRGTNREVVLNRLYQHTPLQSTYSIILLTISNLAPKVFSLKRLLTEFLEFRYQSVRRRTEFELRKAEERAHILEGLKIALDNIDEVVQIIKQSPDTKTAKDRLMSKFKLSEVQSQAILDMRLARLTALERDKIEEEYRKLIQEIERLRTILASRAGVMGVIGKEIKELKKRFGDMRRTEIRAEKPEEITLEDLISEEDVAITLTLRGYIKRTPVSVYRKQSRGGTGRGTIDLGKQDMVSTLLTGSTHDSVLFFSNLGRAYLLKAYEIPEGSLNAKGRPISQLFNLSEGEFITQLLKVKDFTESTHVIFATEQGTIKRMPVNLLENTRRSGITAIGLKDGDRLQGVLLIDADTDICLFSAQGQGIRFSTSQLRPMGRTAAGVRGIKLNEDDRLVTAVRVKEGHSLLFVTRNGYGKRMAFEELRSFTNRGGKGVRAIAVNEKSGSLISAKAIQDEGQAIIITKLGTGIRISSKQVKLQKRASLGVSLISIRENDEAAQLAIIPGSAG